MGNTGLPGAGKLRAAVAASVCLAMTAACQASFESKPKTAESEAAKEVVAVSLGRNLVQEDCRAQPRTRGTVEEIDSGAFDIFCGTWEQPSGRFVPVQPQRVGLVGDNIVTWANTSWWRQQLDQRASCGSPQPTQLLDGLPAVVLDCQMRRGGWPYIAFVAREGGRMFLADGIPPALPALEQAIRRLAVPGQAGQGVATSGPAPVDTAGARSSAIQELEKRLGKVGGGLFSTNDLASFQDLMRLGQLYNQNRNFPGAEAAYRKALEIHERVMGAGNPETGVALVSLALEVSNQGRFDEAVRLFDRAEPLVKASADASDFARFLTYQAMHNANMQRTSEAIKFAVEATKVRRDLSDRARKRQEESDRSKNSGLTSQSSAALRESSINEVDVVQSMRVESSMRMRSGEVGQAETLARQGRDILLKSKTAPEAWSADFNLLLGSILTKQVRYPEATQAIQSAIDTRVRLFGESSSTAFAYMQLGETRFAADDLPGALAAFRKGIAMLSGRGQAAAEVNFERLAPFLHALLTASAREPAQRTALHTEMFLASQLVREGVTGQTISRTAARLAAGDNKVGELVRALQEAERQRDEARFAFGQEQAKPTASRNPELEKQLSTKIEESGRRAVELEQEIQVAFPAYAQLIGNKPISVADMQARLRADEAVLRFVVGDEHSFGILVRRDGLRAFRVGANRVEIDRMVNEVRKGVELVGTGVGEFDLGLSHQLYKVLIEPAIGDLAGVSHLITVPVGSLLSLPYQVLVENPATGRGSIATYPQTRWMGRRFAISVVPSVRALLDLRAVTQVARAPLPFVGFGDPDYKAPYTEPVAKPPTTPVAAPTGGAPAIPAVAPAALGGPVRTGHRVRRPGQAPVQQALAWEGLKTRNVDFIEDACKSGDSVSISKIRALEPLPETADELRQIAGLLGASPDKVVLNRGATVEAVRTARLDQYRVVYFALHGLLPNELGCQIEPALAMSPFGSDKGLLSSSDIAELRLNADMVVLSACNTGGGGGKLGGESLSGLTRSFFFAGARTLLVTHWKVPSIATVALTTGMFQRLGRATSDGAGAVALQQAQVALMDNPATSHPVFWGAFMLVGDGGPRS